MQRSSVTRPPDRAWSRRADSVIEGFSGEILVPPAVWREVAEAGARPGAAEVQKARAEGWLQVKAPASASPVQALRTQLDEGEAEAIALALEFSQILLLLDESEGRETASRLGLACTGTIGVLLRARKCDRLPALKPVLESLVQRHSFRLSRRFYEAVLHEVGEAP